MFYACMPDAAKNISQPYDVAARLAAQSYEKRAIRLGVVIIMKTPGIL